MSSARAAQRSPTARRRGRWYLQDYWPMCASGLLVVSSTETETGDLRPPPRRRRCSCPSGDRRRRRLRQTTRHCRSLPSESAPPTRCSLRSGQPAAASECAAHCGGAATVPRQRWPAVLLLFLASSSSSSSSSAVVVAARRAPSSPLLLLAMLDHWMLLTAPEQRTSTSTQPMLKMRPMMTAAR
jgi:hypothetical protein